MPICLGFSDMAEVFIFLSGYLNGITHRQGVQFLHSMKKPFKSNYFHDSSV